MDTPEPAPPPPMAHRSWYLRRDVADRVAAAVNDIHHTTKIRKHEVLAALFEVTLAHRDEITAQLAQERAA